MRRAGKIDLGETATGAAVRAGRARLLLLAAGCSAPPEEAEDDKAQLSQLLGKTGCSMAACTDFGLSSAFIAALAEAAPDEYGQLAEEMERRADKAARRKAAGPKRKPGRELNE